MQKFKLIILLLFPLLLQGQEIKEAAPSVPLPLKEDKLILTLSSDNWDGLPSYIKSKPFRSRGFSFMFMGDRMLKSGNAGIGLGLGFSSQNVHTDAVIIDTLGGGAAVTMRKIPDSLDYKVNKLSLNFITAALEIRLRTNENSKLHRFKLSAGITAGLLVQSHTKYEDKTGKIKSFGINHLNKFQYGLHGRIGYGSVAISAYFSMVDVFKEGKGPQLTPYSIGASYCF